MAKHIASQKEKWSLVTGEEKEEFKKSLVLARYFPFSKFTLWKRDLSTPPFAVPGSGWELFAVQLPDWNSQETIARRPIKSEHIITLEGGIQQIKGEHAIRLESGIPRYEFRTGLDARLIFGYYPLAIIPNKPEE
jgi:hypothetical protein